jgi:uncharacterized OB-fold protein
MTPIFRRPRSAPAAWDDQEWQPIRGTGTLESWIDVHRAYWPGFAGDLPYRVCLVLLDEGVRIISNLVGPSDDARLGARVTAVFETATDEISIPKFALHDADHRPRSGFRACGLD